MIKTKLKSRRGSSSVLVIMMMLTLVLFGTLAMATSYSDLKLARKSADWTTSYYTLDGRAESFKADLSFYMNRIWAAAGEYVADTGDSTAGFEFTGLNFTDAARIALSQTKTTYGQAEARRRIFYYLVYGWLRNQGRTVKSAADYTDPVQTLTAAAAAAPETGYMSCEIKFEAPGGSQYISMGFDISAAGGFYTVTKWNFVPTQFKYNSNNSVIWNGLIGSTPPAAK